MEYLFFKLRLFLKSSTGHLFMTIMHAKTISMVFFFIFPFWQIKMTTCIFFFIHLNNDTLSLFVISAQVIDDSFEILNLFWVVI